MYKIFAAIVAAAILAAVAVMMPGMTVKVEASTPKAATKGDRLDLKNYGTACSQRGWPYFETNCLRDLASPTRQAKSVRLVSTDRLPYDRSLVMVARGN